MRDCRFRPASCGTQTAIPGGSNSKKKKAAPADAGVSLIFLIASKSELLSLFKKIRLSLRVSLFLFGWKMGFEPTTFGTTIRRSNQLNYIHRFRNAKIVPIFLLAKFWFYFLTVDSNYYICAFLER